ncbi:hypothetical protein [Falsibacillus pallidus]|uniref:hypothetical protein n=1 Tax=Falsibacillus pallidus TaxID=493781 RepID=UPI003D9724BA
MPSVQDAFYNYLTIYYVWKSRQDDTAAKETLEFFNEMLTEDFGIPQWSIEEMEDFIAVKFQQEGKDRLLRFPIELISCMLQQIEDDPARYA